MNKKYPVRLKAVTITILRTNLESSLRAGRLCNIPVMHPSPLKLLEAKLLNPPKRMGLWQYY
jgi:hypothetical protein